MFNSLLICYQNIVEVSIAIIVIVALVAIFIISFIAYKKTPEPKGGEKIKCNDKVCSMCEKTDCIYHVDKVENVEEKKEIVDKNETKEVEQKEIEKDE